MFRLRTDWAVSLMTLVAGSARDNHLSSQAPICTRVWPGKATPEQDRGNFARMGLQAEHGNACHLPMTFKASNVSMEGDGVESMHGINSSRDKLAGVGISSSRQRGKGSTGASKCTEACQSRQDIDPPNRLARRNVSKSMGFCKGLARACPGTWEAQTERCIHACPQAVPRGRCKISLSSGNKNHFQSTQKL
jgi:hypothetical protein